MYWERRFPRLLTNDELRELHSKKMCRLLAVGDITCDIGGSIECVREITAIESPFLRYDPEMGEIHKDMNGEGIIFLAVDCVPTELPKEATKHFGDVLYPFLSSMAHASSPEENLVPIQNACIAHNGKLRPLYEYIHRMRQSQDTMKKQQTAKMNGEKNGQLVRVVSLSGHLFDQYLINEALDVICDAGGRFQVATFKVGQSDAETSHADLQVEADSEEALNGIVNKLAVIAREGRNKQYWNGHAIYSRKTKQSLLQKLKDRGSTGGPQVLILGAGRMCEPAVKYLSDGQFITPRNLQQPVHVRVGVVVASLYLSDAEKVVEGIPNATAAQLDVSDGAQLHELISEANVVISLLPANCHVAVANACIELKKHLVTASYVSTEMDNLNEKAKHAGVTLLCEMGLDPGIDHMLAMKMIDKAHARGGRVQSFVSYCGGLPAPTAANNPLGYKFSWNPSGAIKAGRNPAVYLYQGKKVEVAGEELFASAVPLRLQNTPAFALERLPNRDSLSYGDLYGITNEAATVFRATLRYEGFSEIMAALGKIGFFKMDPLMLTANDAPSSGLTYKAVLELLLSQIPEHPGQFSASETNTVSSNTSWIANKLASLGCCKDSSVAFKAANCIRWLGLDAEESIPEACKNAFDVLCHRMEQRLTYAPNEQDMVLLHHELEVVFDDGHPSEQHTATLLELGETSEQGTELLVRPQSAMARTVGLPVAIAAQLLLFEDVILRGVLRPLHSEIYQPALAILTALGIKVEEHVEKF
ncbi:hypothetical protein CY35_14G031500 [Sphagnum magellanicum]|nr:hypothetical protein CY35_14G031500 [Sphagnum magellanicum]